MQLSQAHGMANRRLFGSPTPPPAALGCAKSSEKKCIEKGKVDGDCCSKPEVAGCAAGYHLDTAPWEHFGTPKRCSRWSSSSVHTCCKKDVAGTPSPARAEAPSPQHRPLQRSKPIACARQSHPWQQPRGRSTARHTASHGASQLARSAHGVHRAHRRLCGVGWFVHNVRLCNRGCAPKGGPVECDLVGILDGWCPGGTR